MKSVKVKMDSLEVRTLITCINDARNILIRENKAYDFLDDILIK